MAVQLLASGTQAAVINTEHSLNTQTTAGVFRAIIDCSNMVAGDIVEIRVYEKPTAAGDTKQLAQYMRIRGPLAKPIKRTVAVEQTVYHEVTLKQVAGTGRNFKWGVNGL